MEEEITIEAANQEAANDFYKKEEVQDTEAEKNEDAQDLKDDSESTEVSEDPKKDEVADDSQEKEDESKETETEKSEEEEKEVEYKLSKKEDSYIDDAFLKDVEEFAKENKLSNEAAQSLLDKQDAALAEIVQKAEDLEEKQIDAWRQEVIADPIMGGDNLAKTSENAKRVIEKFGSQEVIELLNTTGYGNNPHVVKLLSSIGEQMGDDDFIFSGNQVKTDITPEDKFYGN
jgi:hypothetical protein